MSRPGHRQYVTPEWDEVRERCGLSVEQSFRLTEALYREAMALGIARREVRRNRLDNPYLQEHARATILADIRKQNEARSLRIHRTVITRRKYQAARAAAYALRYRKVA